MDKQQIPDTTLEILLKHKKEILDNISLHYKDELLDANQDSEKLFKYGFIFVGLVETVIGGLTVIIQRSTGAALFTTALLFLTLGIATILYERLRIEKSILRQNVMAEREPIMQQIAMLKGFLEPMHNSNMRK